jgi:hypothetical protein
MAFYVGQKVVCVNAGWLLSENLNPVSAEMSLTEGRVYTVVKIRRERGVAGVRLAEADAAPCWGFLAERFRPVVERKTDISIFKAMLNPKTVETVT